jgi:hypothetical protein
VGGTSGRIREHRGIAVELMDMQAAPDSGRSRLSVWRILVAIGIGGRVGKVTSAYTGLEEASVDRFGVGVGRSTTARTVNMVRTFLGAAAA